MADQKKELDGQLAELKARPGEADEPADARRRRDRSERMREYQRLAVQQDGPGGGDQEGRRAGEGGARQADRQAARGSSETQGRVPIGLQRHALSGRWGAASARNSAAPASSTSRRSATARISTRASTSSRRYGTPIRASGPGTVLYVGWNYADGYDPAWIVIIAHSAASRPGTPTCSRRTRCGPASAWSGGQVIGYEGNTGHSTGAHLHWAVRFNGAFVEPAAVRLGPHPAPATLVGKRNTADRPFTARP